MIKNLWISNSSPVPRKCHVSMETSYPSLQFLFQTFSMQWASACNTKHIQMTHNHKILMQCGAPITLSIYSKILAKKHPLDELWGVNCEINVRFILYVSPCTAVFNTTILTQIAKFMGPTWGPPGSCRPQMGPMLAPWTLLSGELFWTML